MEARKKPILVKYSFFSNCALDCDNAIADYPAGFWPSLLQICRA